MPATLPLPLLCLWRGSVLGNGWRGPGKALWGCRILVQLLACPGLMAQPGVGRASYSAGMCSVTAPVCGGSSTWGPGLGGFLQVALDCLARPHRHGREGTNLYTPKSGSQPRKTNTNPVLRPALSIHQDHSGRGIPGPSISPLASWKVRVSILVLQLTVEMATSQHPISLLQAGALAVKPGLRGTETSPTTAPGLGLPHGTGFSALHRLASPTTATIRAMHTHTSHVGGQVTPSPVPSHQALSLPPLPFPHITLALHVILLLS